MGRYRRFLAEEMFVQLAADAIVRRHPQAVWLAEHGHEGNVRLSDATLDEAIKKLEAWITEHDRTTGTGD